MDFNTLILYGLNVALNSFDYSVHISYRSEQLAHQTFGTSE